MQLDRIRATLRPRTAWEGMDLGFALARQWFLPLWLLWWASVLPLALLLLPVTGIRPDLWLLAIWWLKPLYEGPLLVWASRSLFGETLTRRDILRVQRAGLSWRLLPYLLLRRLSPRRSFLMPLELLEGLRGATARQRRKILSGSGGAASWLTLVCYNFELVLWSGVLLAAYFLVPAELPRLDLMAALSDSTYWAYWLSDLAYLAVFSLIAPFYVCSGFALYLTRRTELEAWDLELAFRAARDEVPPRVDGPVAVALLVTVLMAVPGAMPLAASQLHPDQARPVIEEVLSSPDFGGERQRQTWTLSEEPDDPADDASISRKRLAEIAVWVGRVLKVTLLAFAVIALLLIGWRVMKTWRSTRQREAGGAGLGVPPVSGESVGDAAVDDVTGTVGCLLAQGDRRGALALLYRASIDHLHRQGVVVAEGSTEHECLDAASRALSEARLGPLRRLIREWQQIAYAHRPPSDDAVCTLLRAWSHWTEADVGARAER